MRHLVEQAGLSGRIGVDSAGTGAWHAGEPPDKRSIEVARRKGVSLAGQRARQVSDADYFDCDLLLAMDQSNQSTLLRGAPDQGCRARIELLLAPPRGDGGEVPDPYYGGDGGFDHVYDLVFSACQTLLEQLGEELEK